MGRFINGNRKQVLSRPRQNGEIVAARFDKILKTIPDKASKQSSRVKSANKSPPKKMKNTTMHRRSREVHPSPLRRITRGLSSMQMKAQQLVKKKKGQNARRAKENCPPARTTRAFVAKSKAKKNA